MTLSRIGNGLNATAIRFARAERGNVAMMFAVVLPVLLTFIGAAIDYSRAVNARSAMQAAVDATALMISKEANSLSPTDLTTKAKSYFTALYSHPEVAGVTFAAVYSTNSGSGASVKLDARGTMQTDFMKLAGYPTMPLSVSSTTKWGNIRYRVALALDNTGSMASASKMSELKKAAKKLIDDFYAMASTNEDVYISIVPFAKDVNIGSDKKNETWLRWSGAADSYEATQGKCSDYSDWLKTKSACENWGFTWTFNKNNWNGCVMDRDKNQDYDTTIVNAMPDAGNAGTMVWPEQYNACPAKMIGMTSVKASKQTLVNKINEMQPNGATNQGIGAFWAWMTHATSGPFPTPSKDSNYVYQDVIILLTDGLNTQNRFDGNGSDHSTQVDARQALLCANARKEGIKIFAIQVATDGEAVSTVTKNCVNDPNNPNYFSYLKQASQMTLQFEKIFKELAKLRVAK